MLEHICLCPIKSKANHYNSALTIARYMIVLACLQI